jgi:prepilin-type N-terminal cleavage/methylation domain-containing protein
MNIYLNNKRNKYKLGKGGFSLIELMVVVAILSFIILGLVTFFSGGVRSWISGQNQLKAQREARIAVDRMVKEIREANNVVSGYENGIEVSFPSSFGKANVSYELNTSTGTIERNSTNNLISYIPSGGFSIDYYDSESNPVVDPTNASKIKINLQVDVDQDGKMDIEIETEVNLRNYGTG